LAQSGRATKVARIVRKAHNLRTNCMDMLAILVLIAAMIVGRFALDL
jgi:hypothetical protein